LPQSRLRILTSIETIMEAVKESGVRALVSAGWGGLGGADVPPEVFILKGKLIPDVRQVRV
jgi:hypothetical protein